MSVAAQAHGRRWPVRYFLALVLLVTLPLLIFEIFNHAELRESREEEIQQDARRLLNLIEAEQQRIMDDIHHVLVVLTEMGVDRMDASACLASMARIKTHYPSYLAINISDGNSTIWCSTVASAAGESVADRPYRRQALNTDEIVTGQFILSRTTGRPAIPIARAYHGKDGSRAGSVAVLLDIGWLEHYLAEKPLPENAAVLIADRAGTILARVPAIPGLAGQSLPERFQPLLKGTAKGIVEIPELDGASRVTAYAPVMAGGPDLYLQISLDKAAAMQSVNLTALRSLLIFAGLLLTTGFGAAWGISRFLNIRDQAQQNAFRTAALLASTVDGVVELDQEWRFTFLNDKAKILIAQGRDVIGLTLWEAIPELVDSLLWEKAHQAMVELVPTDAEFQGMHTGRWFWMRAFPSADGLTLYLLDITRRREAEESLRENKDRLNLALQSAQAGTFDWDLRTGKGYWSEEGYHIFGLDPQRHSVDYDLWRSILHPDDVAIADLGDLTQLYSEKKPYLRLEYRIVHPDGSVHWIATIGRIRYGASGKPQQVSGLNIDITERKAMEEALRRSEERLTIALAAAEAGIWDFDVRSRILTWSDGMYRLYGVSPEGFVPSVNSFYDRIHPDDRDAVRLFTQDVLESRRPDYRAEFRITHPEEGLRWIMAIGRPIYGRDGQPVRLSGLNIDITARKAMEEALREAKANADAANLSKSKFLAAASHDLRQPLQSALLFAGVLHGHIGDERGRRPLTSLERALDTLKSLLDSLLDVSRLDAGVIVPQVIDVPLGPLLEELRASYAPIATSKGLEFHVDQPCATLAVRSDPLLLERMLRNLLENAVRYTERGHVQVGCTLIPDGLRIEVQDSGIGISPEHMARVFEEFHQVGNPERDRSQGLGLGLAIVQRLAKLLHHAVTVRSELGKGSVFSIEVPRPIGPAKPLPLPEPMIATTGQGRLAILVDDDVIVLAGLQTVFQEWGYDVVIAGSTEQALERLQSVGRVPDLVIADYRLRDKRVGTEAVVKIRNQVGQPVPGIILTGEIGAECERDAAAHDLAIVHKPITPRQLHTTVQRVLGR